MAIFDLVTKKFLCDCHCGEEVNWPSDFRQGHHMRMEEHRERNAEQASERFSGVAHSKSI